MPLERRATERPINILPGPTNLEYDKGKKRTTMIEEMFTREQVDLRNRARELAETVMRPVAAKYDEAQEYPWEVKEAIQAAGLSGVWSP